MHLMPLVERVPFAGREEIPAQAAPPRGEIARYAAGNQRRLLDLGGVEIGAPIGTETLLGSHVAGFVADGADVIISPAQTGWWAPAPIASQHLRLSRLRAVESGRAVLIATVSGPSALITPDGAIQMLGAESARAAFHVRIPLYTGTTPYVQHGDFVWYAGALVSGLLTLVGLAAAAARRTAPRGRPSRAETPRPAFAA
jgi:apolipoprotein N-acyltransferase